MKIILTFLAATMLFCTASLYAQTPVPYDDPYLVIGSGLGTGTTQTHQTYNRTLFADTVYYLTGTYIVDNGFSLTIQPGTIIRGDSGGALLIATGAKIYANGTADKPIIFTSAKPVSRRARGDWAGIIICGLAPINQVNPTIEGGNLPGTYGGSDPNDNSGVLKYVRVEYPGYRYALNSEINGITLCGVGRGTEIHHCQVSYSFDDSFEFFGGTVDVKNLVVFGGADDEFDSDFGYIGRGQFLFGMRDPDMWDPNGESNGFESDNMGSPSQSAPKTRARFSNVSLIGPRRIDAIPGGDRSGNKFQYSAVLRRGTQLSFYNSVIAGYPGGLALRDTITWGGALRDSLQIRNSNIAAWDGVSFFSTNTNAGITATAVQNWYNTSGWANWGLDTTHAISEIGLTDMSNLNNPDPRPASGSILLTGGTSFSGILDKDLGGTGFYDETVTYRGAFAPTTPMSGQWTAGWTNFDPQHTMYNVLNNGWNLISVPVTPTSYSAASLFPNASGTIYSYNGTGYDAATTLENGKAYWAFYTAQSANTMAGDFLQSTSVTAAAAGWVLVGSVSYPLATSQITTTPANMISGSFFAYNGTTYVATTQLNPGKGYWVFVTGACTINMP